MRAGSMRRFSTRWPHGSHSGNHPGAAVPVLSRDLSPPEDLLARAQRDEIVARTTGLRPTQGAVEQTYGGEWEAPPGAPDPP